MRSPRTPIALVGLLPFFLACGDSGPGRGRADEVYGEFAFATHTADDAGPPRKGGRAVIALVADVDNFNPYLSTTAYAREIHHHLYPHVLREEPDFHKGPPSMRPNLAEHWEVEGKQVRFRLRDGLVWSDGTPLTSSDVEFSLAAAKHSAVAWVNGQIVDYIDRIEVIDDRNYVVHFETRYPYMLKDAKDFRVLPKHVYGKVAFEDWKSHRWEDAARVVSGPYELGTHKPNEEFTLVPNERYWNREHPRLQRVIVRILGHKPTMLESLLAGEIDGIDQVAPDKARRVLEAKDYLLYNFGGLIYEYVGWNCEHELFRDPVVRRALTLAIDRENIIESLMHGYGRPMASPFLSSSWALDRDLAPHPYDPENALGLLASRGWTRNDDGKLAKHGRRFEFTLSVAAGRDRRIAASQYIQSDLRKIGVEVKTLQVDFNAMSEMLREGRADAWIGGWWLSTKVDAKAFFHSDSIGNFNFCRWSDARVDALIDGARMENDRAVAMARWKEFQKIFHEQQPYTLLYEMPMLNALHRRFNGVRMTAQNTYDNLHEWWVD